MRSPFFLSLALACLLGCATTGRYEDVLDSWKGNEISRLNESWGPPSSTQDLSNGNKLYIWLKSGNSVVYSDYDKISSGTMSSWCRTVFTTSPEGIIVSWHWEGNSCVADSSTMNSRNNFRKNHAD